MARQTSDVFNTLLNISKGCKGKSFIFDGKLFKFDNFLKPLPAATISNSISGLNSAILTIISGLCFKANVPVYKSLNFSGPGEQDWGDGETGMRIEKGNEDADEGGCIGP